MALGNWLCDPPSSAALAPATRPAGRRTRFHPRVRGVRAARRKEEAVSKILCAVVLAAGLGVAPACRATDPQRFLVPYGFHLPALSRGQYAVTALGSYSADHISNVYSGGPNSYSSDHHGLALQVSGLYALSDQVAASLGLALQPPQGAGTMRSHDSLGDLTQNTQTGAVGPSATLVIHPSPTVEIFGTATGSWEWDSWTTVPPSGPGAVSGLHFGTGNVTVGVTILGGP